MSTKQELLKKVKDVQHKLDILNKEIRYMDKVAKLPKTLAKCKTFKEQVAWPESKNKVSFSTSSPHLLEGYVYTSWGAYYLFTQVAGNTFNLIHLATGNRRCKGVEGRDAHVELAKSNGNMEVVGKFNDCFCAI